MDKREQYLQVQVSSVVGISGKLRHSFGPLHFDGNTTWAVFFFKKNTRDNTDSGNRNIEEQ